VQSVAGKLMRKDSTDSLHQNRYPSVQKTNLLSLARVCRNPPFKTIKQGESCCVKYAQGLYRNWLKEVTSTNDDMFSTSLQLHLRQDRLC